MMTKNSSLRRTPPLVDGGQSLVNSPDLVCEDKGNNTFAAAPMQKLKKDLYLNNAYVDTGLLKIGPQHKTSNIITESRLEPLLPVLEKYYELWLAYPDKLVQMLSSSNKSFKLFPFQQFGLRIQARYEKSMQIATRGFSKSFSNVIGRLIDAILLPRSKGSLLAEHKNQATKIASEKFAEIFDFIPALSLEINEAKGARTVESDHFIRKVLKNKSQIDIVGIENSVRGGRRHALLFEEIKDLEADKINGNVLPLLNIARRTSLGELNPREIHQKQVYVGSAGYVDSFAHDKAVEIMVDSVLRPDKAFYWGGDYKIPMFYGLLSPSFVEDLKNSGSYSDADFAREFLAKWSSTIEGSYFDAEKLRKLRQIKRAEFSAMNDPGVEYYASVDVGRTKAVSALEIFKVRKQEDHFTIDLVNIILMPGRHFGKQAAQIKAYDAAFNFKKVIIDANGMGHGLVDFLLIENPHEENTYPAWGIANLDEYPEYKKDLVREAPNKLFILKTGVANAGPIHVNCFNMLFSGRVRLLVDEKTAKHKLLTTKKGQKMGLEERKAFLTPYRNTAQLLRETTNLAISKNSAGVKLEKIKSSEEKDTFSALEYGLWLISLDEKEWVQKKRKRFGRKLSGFTMFN